MTTKGNTFKVIREYDYVLLLPAYCFDENPCTSDFKKLEVFRGEWSHKVNSVELPVFLK